MHFFLTPSLAPDLPLNTTFEDSIHMPQNHSNRNRRKGGGNQNARSNVPADTNEVPYGPHATPAARNIGTGTVQLASRVRQEHSSTRQSS
jgi:hypothetical protein